MKSLTVLLLLGLAAIAVCRPDTIINFELEDQAHELEGDAEERSGTVSWTSPEGVNLYYKYVADEYGYRIVESNAVPVSGAGVRADGQQVSFDSYEVEEDDD
ncbi:uncharacterized protein LOC143017519 [Oratosquilla oratoria]|uniref:uncharacterized protein LOC143017519 n=1 Tax=Oratosquilla oratoria TaxID=337810 RepID=UPI003F76AA6B